MRASLRPVPDDALERDLSRLFDVAPPPGLEALVRARLGALDRARPTGGRHEPRSHRRIALVAAIVVLVFAACAVAVDRLDPFGRTGSVEVGRGTPLDLSVEASGWRLSLVNAYADTNALTVFLFAEPLGDVPDSTMVEVRDVAVTDEKGRAFVLGGSYHASLYEGRSIQEVSFAPPDGILPAGEHRLRAQVNSLVLDDLSLERVEGPWTFDIEVRSQGGTILEPGSRDEHHGIAITLDRVAVSPSQVTVSLTIEGAPAGKDWVPWLQVVKGPKQWDGFGYGSWNADGSRTVTASLGGGGLDDAVGEWSVMVHALSVYDYDSAGDDHIVEQLTGPWDLSFEATAP